MTTTTIKFSGPQGCGKTTIAVEVTDFLRKKGLLVVSIYDDPKKMTAAAGDVLRKLMVDADVIVEAYEQ